MSLVESTGLPGVGTRSRPGRPRDRELETQAIDAVVQLLDAGEEVTVSRIVELSGVSRAAIYRRWPSLTLLIAAALDVGRSAYPVLVPERNLRELITRGFLPGAHGHEYPLERFRLRMKLISSDPVLQQAYWNAHVARRRAPLEEALLAAVQAGELHACLDVSSALDALAGVVYYQLVVRGADINAPDTRARMEAAFDLIWQGMRPVPLGCSHCNDE